MFFFSLTQLRHALSSFNLGISKFTLQSESEILNSSTNFALLIGYSYQKAISVSLSAVWQSNI